ncbi:MAG: alpha/beta hydrolase [Thermoguttaceae bacterium]|nr:alpha/beta hydrolase [Thermoguttaceae bacterium]
MTQTSTKDHESQNAPSKPRRRRWLRVVFVLLILCLIFTASCGLYLRRAMKDGGYLEDWDSETDGQVLEDVKYGTESWQVMDVYIPKNFQASQMRGAVLFIHGGAWIGGSRMEQVGFAKRAAKDGYLTANMEYMLYRDDVKSEYSITRVLDDVDAAIAKLKEIGEELGCELDRVALSGHSAGGHISSLYAYSRGKEAPLEVAFIMARVAPIDFHADAWAPNLKAKSVAGLVSAMTGTEIDAAALENPDEKTEELINSVSPLSYVKPGVTPTLSAYGAKDSIVPAGHPRKIKEAFEKLEAKSVVDVHPADTETPVFDYIEFPTSNHMLARDPDCTMRLWGLFLSYSKRYLQKHEEHGDILSEWGTDGE